MATLDNTDRLGFVMRKDDKTIYIFSSMGNMDNLKGTYVWYVRVKRKRVVRRNNKTKGD
jgi:hypothetical protein